MVINCFIHLYFVNTSYNKLIIVIINNNANKNTQLKTLVYVVMKSIIGI